MATGSTPASPVTPGSSVPAHAHRDQHLRWLLEITQIPTAAGREWRVVEWIRAWVNERPDLRLSTDAAGNLVVAPVSPWNAGSGTRPVYITAHLDHPAFVVKRIVSPTVLELEFRGGVMDDYFAGAKVRIHTGPRPGDSSGTGEIHEACFTGTLTGTSSPKGAMFATYLCELNDPEAPEHRTIRVGDVAVWDLLPAQVDAHGIVHTHACDDLAALAAAVSAFDTLRELAARGSTLEDVRLLFTRSEEIGFTGAIAACKLGTMPKDARVIALENSRSFSDSPIGGGPIVRVGDRMSVFDPRLTAACARRAEDVSGAAANPTASQKNTDLKGWRWQRKLMAGGACEATVFCAYGYQATCLCLPLGNYHNMSELASVQDGTYDRARLGPPKIDREFIARSDYEGLVDLLVAIGQSLPEADPALPRIEKLYTDRAYVLDEA